MNSYATPPTGDYSRNVGLPTAYVPTKFQLFKLLFAPVFIKSLVSEPSDMTFLEAAYRRNLRKIEKTQIRLS